MNCVSHLASLKLLGAIAPSPFPRISATVCDIQDNRVKVCVKALTISANCLPKGGKDEKNCSSQNISGISYHESLLLNQRAKT